MGLLRRHRWFVAAAGITLAFAGVSLTAHRSLALTAFADLFGLALLLATAAALLVNAIQGPRQERSFWSLLAFGYALWVSNQIAWCYFEIVRQKSLPDPFSFDIVLFFHAVPMIAAVAWRPDIRKKDGKVLLSLLNFVMLLGWWIFLYAFVVFPYQYVRLDIPRYNGYYDDLYLLEHGLLIAALGLAAWTSSGGWRRLYSNLLGGMVVYTVGSQLLNRAINDQRYYSGSLYDVLFILPLAWLGATSLSARSWGLSTQDSWLGPLKGATDAAARNFLVFRFGERARLALRPSGTEPKAKAYIEACSAPCPPGATAEAWERTRREMDELARRLADDFLRLALGTVGLEPPGKSA